MIDLKGTFYKSFRADTEMIEFDKISPLALWKIRYRLGEMLSKAAPEYRRSLVSWQQPEWNIDRLPDIGHVRVAPQIESYKPDCDSFK